MSPSTRLFISYRARDGRDKATALARDLGSHFGPEQVFLDKDDLTAGRSWRQEVGAALHQRPVVVLLITPELLRRDEAGGFALDAATDPVRQELQAAAEAGATVLPVLCDGLPDAPDLAQWPATLRALSELTWRRLRAYDWSADVARLVADLRALGLAHAVPAGNAPRKRWWAGVAAALALVAAGAWWQHSTASPWAGRWHATWVRGEQTVLELTEQAGHIHLVSEPVSLAGRADWATYQAQVKQMGGVPPTHIIYRGIGQRLPAEPGQNPKAEIAFKVHGQPGDEAIDSGALALRLAGRKAEGTLWLNGEQAEHAAVLQRP